MAAPGPQAGALAAARRLSVVRRRGARRAACRAEVVRATRSRQQSRRRVRGMRGRSQTQFSRRRECKPPMLGGEDETATRKVPPHDVGEHGYSGGIKRRAWFIEQ